MCDSCTQSGNGSSTLTSIIESVSTAGSVDVSAGSHQDSMAEVARQVSALLTVHLENNFLLFLTVLLQKSNSRKRPTS